MVGFFIQFSTLGANFLVIQIWGEDILNKSRNDIVCFSLLWSFFTSAMAIIILAFLRNIVSIAYLSVFQRSQQLVEEMVLNLECRFVVGALIGVCTAWTITDALMGMLRVEKVNSPKRRPHCGWESLQALRNDHPEMNQLLAWLGGSLESGKVKPFQPSKS